MVYYKAIEDLEPDEENIADQLEDIKESIKFLVETAMNLLPRGHIKDRATAYWYYHIITMLDDNNEIYARQAGKISDTIEELRENGY